MSLTKRDYEEAILVQDACNLSGVVFGWARMMEKICDEANELGKGTDWRNCHPINVMFASKIASLTGCETMSTFSKAYEACKRYAETA